MSQAMSASTIVKLFLILGLLFSSIGGLVVASILKKLDNVVKVNIYIILSQQDQKDLLKLPSYRVINCYTVMFSL